MSSDLEFDAGVGFDLGLGYDFVNIRVEETWDRITSGGAEFGDNDLDEHATVDGYQASIYNDFENSSKWTPFIVESLGIVNADVDGDDASSLYCGIQRGVSYEVSDQLDIIGKAFYLRANDLDSTDSKMLKCPQFLPDRVCVSHSDIRLK